MAYKLRVAARLQKKRTGAKEESKKMLLSVGFGHAEIIQLFRKTDEELLLAIEKYLKKLKEIDSVTTDMWESIFRIVEVRAAESEDTSADACCPINVTGPRRYAHAYVHVDERLEDIVRRTRNA